MWETLMGTGWRVPLAFVLALGASPASAQKVWRHAIIEAKSDAGFAMMVTRGFAEKQGLNLEIMQIKADQIGLKALLAGELDSYEGGPGGAIVAAARGADLKILGCHWPGLVHGLFAREGVAKIEDLRGKNIAISAPGALPDLLIRAVLEKRGIAPNEVKFANMGSDTDRYKALTVGVVDAAIVSTEYLPIAPKTVKLLATGREALPNFMRVCMISSAKALADKADEAARFLAAEISALRYAVAHRDEEIKLTREVTKTKADDPRPGFIFDEATRHKDIDPEVSLPMEKLAWMQEMLIKNGSMPKPIDLAKVVAPDVRAKALELVK
jgi:NitT/TauT family transport system substrate-binding protein